MCNILTVCAAIKNNKSSFYLRHGRLVQIQLQTLDHFIEVSSLETDYVFGYPRSVSPATDHITHTLILLYSNQLIHGIKWSAECKVNADT